MGAADGVGVQRSQAGFVRAFIVVWVNDTEILRVLPGQANFAPGDTRAYFGTPTTSSVSLPIFFHKPRPRTLPPLTRSGTDPRPAYARLPPTSPNIGNLLPRETR